MQHKALAALGIALSMLLTGVVAFPPSDIFGADDAAVSASHDHDDHDHGQEGARHWSESVSAFTRQAHFLSDHETHAQSDADDIIRERSIQEVQRHLWHGHHDAHGLDVQELLCQEVGCSIPLGHDDDPIPDEVEQLICEYFEFPSLPEDGECSEDGDYTLPGPGLPDNPADTDALYNLTQEIYIIGMESLATAINTVGALQQAQEKGTQTFHAGDVDRDEDGIPDFYIYRVTNAGCKNPAGGGCGSGPAENFEATVRIQSDFVMGPLSEGQAVILDPTTGDAYSATAEHDSSENRFTVLISRNGVLHSTLTFDPNEQHDILVYRVVDESAQYHPPPKWPSSVPLLGIIKGDPIYWSAVFDLGYVRLAKTGDIDGDGTSDLLEILQGSHPINPRSTPSNLDGDFCSAREDPNDANPAVCLPFSYDLNIQKPDSDPTDGRDGWIWDTVPLHVTAVPNITFDPAQIPRIAHWELWMTHDKLGGDGHTPNGTVGTDFEPYKDDCDFKPASGPGNPDNYDLDPVDHERCAWAGEFVNKQANIFNVPHRLGGGKGLLSSIDEVVLLDTTLYRDFTDYHIYMFVCLEQEDCPLMFEQKRDVRDHFYFTPHVRINNKPVLELKELIDVDNVTERSGVDFSGRADLNLSVGHPLDHPIVWLNITERAWKMSTGNNPSPQPRGSQSWTFNVFGMSEGETRANLTGDLDELDHDLATTFVTLVDAETDTYTVSLDTAEFPWVPGQLGGTLEVTANALIGSLISPNAEVKDWPDKDKNLYLKYFNNRAPVLTNLAITDISIDPDQGDATIDFGLHYVDADANNASPTIIFEILNDAGAVIDSGGSCVKIVPLEKTADPPGNHNADYECTVSTDLWGTYEWQIRARDADAGANTSVTPGPVLLDIPNLGPELSDPSISTDPMDVADESENRTVKFQIRYKDAEDASTAVWGEIFSAADGSSVGVVPMSSGATCVDSPSTGSGQIEDHCGQFDLARGNYTVRFYAENLRNGSAVFPPLGEDALPFEVGDVIVIVCEWCGTNQDHMSRLAAEARAAAEAANEILADLPPLPNAWQPVQCPCHNETVDPDQDGFITREEEEANPPSDPNDPWSNPADHDGDLWPTYFDDGPVEVNLLRVRNGIVSLKDNPYVSVYTQLTPGADRGKPLLNVELNRDDEFYNVTVTTATGVTHTVAGTMLLEWEVSQFGVTVIGRDQNGNERLVITTDAEKIGTEDAAFRIWVEATGSQIHEASLYTNPLKLVVNDEVVEAPVGVEKDASGYRVWANLTGEKEYVPEEGVPLPVSLPTNGSPIPAALEAQICRISSSLAAVVCPGGTLASASAPLQAKETICSAAGAEHGACGDDGAGTTEEGTFRNPPLPERLATLTKDGGRS